MFPYFVTVLRFVYKLAHNLLPVYSAQKGALVLIRILENGDDFHIRFEKTAEERNIGLLNRTRMYNNLPQKLKHARPLMI